jgi:hypothetical protein
MKLSLKMPERKKDTSLSLTLWKWGRHIPLQVVADEVGRERERERRRETAYKWALDFSEQKVVLKRDFLPSFFLLLLHSKDAMKLSLSPLSFFPL